MANLRDIINAATPGPWTAWLAEAAIDRSGEMESTVSATAGTRMMDVYVYAPDTADAAYIAAYSPDHALLIEAFIDAFVADEEQQTTLSEVTVYTAFNALAAYRRERGLDG